MKVVSAHQPDFLPYLGFYDRLFQCDIFVIMDDVQLIRQGWHNRNKIKTVNGPVWITVPVLKTGRGNQSILDVQIDQTQKWRRKILRGITFNYQAAKYFEEFFYPISKIFESDYELLIDLNYALILHFIAVLNIDVEIVRASTLGLKRKRNEYLIDLVKSVGGDAYLSGTGAKEYMNEKIFEEESIDVIWQKFNHPNYSQCFGDFTPNMSAIDLLLNCGPKSGAIISTNQV